MFGPPEEPSTLLELECAPFLGLIGNVGNGLSQAIVSGEIGVSMIRLGARCGCQLKFSKA